jgi:hypothetical protein
MSINVVFNINENKVILNIDLKKTLLQLKKFIIVKYLNNDCEYIDIININNKVIKNFGKMYLELGVVPRIFDNYELERFFNDNEEFNIKYKIVDIKEVNESYPKKYTFKYNDNDFPELS